MLSSSFMQQAFVPRRERNRAAGVAAQDQRAAVAGDLTERMLVAVPWCTGDAMARVIGQPDHGAFGVDVRR